MKFWIRIALLTIIDFGIFWLWIKQLDPDPSISIGIIIIVPFVIILNLIVALLLYFFKREYASLFVINSIISGILMFYLFEKGIDRHQNERIESWKFEIQDTTFVIHHWKLESTFSISESSNAGSSTGFLDGKFSKKGNEYFLTTDSAKYKIKRDYLFGFRNSSDSIKLIKIER
jgi:hypothetical protein